MKQNLNKKSDIYIAYSRAFSKNSLAHSIIEDPYFIDLIDAIKQNPDISVTRKDLKNVIIEDGNKIKESVIKNLATSKTPITLAIDGWTNVRSNKVTIV